MNSQERESLHELLRYHQGVIGAARLTVLGLSAMMEAFKQVKGTPEVMGHLMDELLDAVHDSKPRLVALTDLLAEVDEEVRPYFRGTDAEEARRRTIEALKKRIDHFEEKLEALTRQGLDHIEDGDTILVHSASSVVTNVLIRAMRERELGFQVLVLQLDPVRTPMVARALQDEGIPYLVVPMHDLCHWQEQVDKLFIGALTVTPDLKMVAPKGTAAVLSICHLAGIRTYLFATTLHYSKGEPSAKQIHQTSTEVSDAPTPYQLISHSHDLVDLGLINVIVNEHGAASVKDAPLPMEG